MNEFLKELEENVPSEPKESVELLNMKVIEKTLAKQQEYSQTLTPSYPFIAISKPTKFNRFAKDSNKKILKNINLTGNLKSRKKAPS